MREDNAAATEMAAADNSVRHIHHHAHACWDSEETRHFYEDILGMPLVATVVLEDPLRDDGSRYCHTLFEMADGNVLAFFEHTSLFHPKHFTARSGFHRRVVIEVEGDAVVRQFKCKLDAAGVTNVLTDHGESLSLRFNDPNGLILEFIANIPPSSEHVRISRALARANLQQWLHYRQNWWRNAAGMQWGSAAARCGNAAGME
jgi:catechol 2,3-dioxygenase-like lactoylglutathione lyase family enzyme